MPIPPLPLRVVIKDKHRDIDVLHKRDKQTGMSFQMDLADIFFGYYLEIYEQPWNMLEYAIIFS